MPVEIKIYHETAQQVLEELQTLSGGLVRAPETAPSREIAASEPTDESGQTAGFAPKEIVGVTNTPRAGESEAQTAARRERGKPSPGRARRTKEEIAEDEAAEKVDASEGVDEDEMAASSKPAFGISSGEERVNPEEEAQDAADEAEERAAKATGDLTHDDLRRALGEYQKKHGMKAAVEAVKPDGLIGCTVDKVPVEEIADVIAKLKTVKLRGADPETAAAREIPGLKETEPKPVVVSMQDVADAMYDYAEKYDGTRTDQTKMPATMADMPRIFQDLFGEEINSLGKIAGKAPTDPKYAVALSAIRDAIVNNPFERERKS